MLNIEKDEKERGMPEKKGGNGLPEVDSIGKTDESMALKILTEGRWEMRKGENSSTEVLRVKRR